MNMIFPALASAAGPTTAAVGSATFGLVCVIIFIALVFDFLNGFHDAANSIATVVSTRVLTPTQAVVWAAFFNFAAAFIFGTKVAETISGKLIIILCQVSLSLTDSATSASSRVCIVMTGDRAVGMAFPRNVVGERVWRSGRRGRHVA